jgi:hypothetical protein
VEVTKLSLLLKVLEGENEQTMSRQLRMFHERALPDLGSNIKCGNSLIGPDFYEGKQLSLMDDEERLRINVFDWKKEFPEIFAPSPQGEGRGEVSGFDAVIGNPPYVRQETLGREFKEYARKKYTSYASAADLYTYFVEQSHRLLKQDGLFGMICSNKFMRSNYGSALRSFLAKQTTLAQVVDFGELPVFQKAGTFPAILLWMKRRVSNQSFVFAQVKTLSLISLDREVTQVGVQLTEKAVAGDNWSLVGGKEGEILQKMRSVGKPLGDYVGREPYFGIKTGLNEAFVIDSEVKSKLIRGNRNLKSFIKPFALGDDIRKYHINYRNRFLIVIPKGWTNQNVPKGLNPWSWFSRTFPDLASHLLKFKEQAENRTDQGEYWWELRACEYYPEFDKPKIVYPDIAKESRATIDRTGLYVTNTVYFFPSNDLYLLGLMNSRLMFSYFKRSAAVLGDADRGGRLRWFTQDVIKLPIRAINFSDPADKSRHDRMVEMVEEMLTLHKQLASAKTEHEKTALQRQIDTTDKQIDQLVYELYGLTEEEVKIVEAR